MAAGVAAEPVLVDRLDELRRGLGRSRLERFGKRRHGCDLIAIGIRDQGSAVAIRTAADIARSTPNAGSRVLIADPGSLIPDPDKVQFRTWRRPWRSSAPRQTGSKFGNKALRAFEQQGYTVIPINPHEAEIEGHRAYRIGARRSWADRHGDGLRSASLRIACRRGARAEGRRGSLAEPRRRR